MVAESAFISLDEVSNNEASFESSSDISSDISSSESIPSFIFGVTDFASSRGPVGLSAVDMKVLT